MFEPKNLAIMAYGNNMAFCNYKTPDKIETVTATGYFKNSCMKKDDVILITAADSCAFYKVNITEKGNMTLKALNSAVADNSFEIQPKIDDLNFEELPSEAGIEEINLRLYELSDKVNSVISALRAVEIIEKS